MFDKKNWSLYGVAIVADIADLVAAPILQAPIIGDIVDLISIAYFINKGVNWYALIAVPEFIPVLETVPFHVAAILVWDWQGSKKKRLF